MAHSSATIRLIGRFVGTIYRWRGIEPVNDPVCGMAVDPRTARRSADYNGHTYYFCGPACRKTFLADPQSVLAPGYAPSM